jgi:flagellar hook protein FlgE
MLRTPLTGLTAASKQLSAISNNLANASTTGFKKSMAQFADVMGESTAMRPGSEAGKGVMSVAMRRSVEQGGMKQTGGSLDVALQGAGYLVFGDAANPTGEGDMSFSRAGALTITADGYLVDQSGAPVMGNPALSGTLQNPNLQSINIFKAVGNDPSKLGSITVDAQGLVSVTNAATGAINKVAYLAVARFENDNGLKAIGNTRYTTSQDSGEPQYGRGGSDGLGVFAQGNLEQSNVDITSELMNMIAAQQAYNGSSRALQAGSEMLRNAAEKIG